MSFTLCIEVVEMRVGEADCCVLLVKSHISSVTLVETILGIRFRFVTLVVADRRLEYIFEPDLRNILMFRRQLANQVVAFYEYLIWGVLASASGDKLLGRREVLIVPQELMPCRRAHARNDNRYAKLARFGILKILKL